jgi:2-methylisocitrate lyase-like PEP mutase family enzyme
MTLQEKAKVFSDLHTRDGAFIIPNPWDIGSACLMEALGFKALATTSSGFAYSMGRLDGKMEFDEIIDHCRTMSNAVAIPVSADLENCYADDPEGISRTIKIAAEAGVVGGSIEDFTGNDANPIYDFDLAVERVHAAVEAAQSLDFQFTLTARSENLFRGIDDLDDTIRRLQAFEKAGADVLYAPGIKTIEEVKIVVDAVNKPLNVLAPLIPGVTVDQLSDAGVKRISIGGALARSAVSAVVLAGREMMNNGSFDWASKGISGSEIDLLLNP